MFTRVLQLDCWCVHSCAGTEIPEINDFSLLFNSVRCYLQTRSKSNSKEARAICTTRRLEIFRMSFMEMVP